MTATPDGTCDQPLTVSLVVQMAGMHVAHQPGLHYTGDLESCAQSWCGYFVHNLGKLTEPRGGDLMVMVALTRGEETVGRSYRDGRYLTANPATAEAGQ